MTITNGYLELTDLQATLSAGTFSTNEADYELAIETASRWIDARCSDLPNNRVRHFWRDAAPTTRLYHARDPRQVCVGDFTDPSGLTVEVYTGGVWAPLAADRWQSEPLVLVNDHPYTRLVATDYADTFPLGLRPRVRCTTRWGWLVIPKPVSQACQILAIAAMLGKDLLANEDGYTGSSDPFSLAEKLLREYLPDDDPAKTAIGAPS